SRTNEWGLDPKIPRRLQPVVFRGYGNASYNGGYYNRGHQLPSADRLAYDSNVQTFYGTNMTPQRGELNADAWAVLEGMVRTWANTFDTLYVVTGCTLEGSTESVTDNEGKRVKVPTGYFKALLGYKKNGTVGMTASAGGYTGTAFWFDHRGYANNTWTVLGQRITIDQLETQTGIDFFVNLPSRIGADKAAAVEASIDSWWK
ncbi:MAG: DNA/RNA non-specific endonuclease, partial [Bacteroidales bacterium]|nr:DNA/RNA non-specific endonuclease [Bacteroidales bacterium]